MKATEQKRFDALYEQHLPGFAGTLGQTPASEFTVTQCHGSPLIFTLAVKKSKG